MQTLVTDRQPVRQNNRPLKRLIVASSIGNALEIRTWQEVRRGAVVLAEMFIHQHRQAKLRSQQPSLA